MLKLCVNLIKLENLKIVIKIKTGEEQKLRWVEYVYYYTHLGLVVHLRHRFPLVEANIKVSVNFHPDVESLNGKISYSNTNSLKIIIFLNLI